MVNDITPKLSSWNGTAGRLTEKLTARDDTLVFRSSGEIDGLAGRRIKGIAIEMIMRAVCGLAGQRSEGCLAE